MIGELPWQRSAISRIQGLEEMRQGSGFLKSRSSASCLFVGPRSMLGALEMFGRASFLFGSVQITGALEREF